MYYLASLALALVFYLAGYLHGRHKGYWLGVNERADLPPLTEEEKRHGYFEMTYRNDSDSD